MELSERLRSLRTERQWRLQDIAPRAHVSVPYLSDLERGRTLPSMETLGRLAAAYGLSVQELLRGTRWSGEATSGGLPRGLQELLGDPVYGPQLTPDWVQTLRRVELRGKRPKDRDDWLSLFLHLRRILQ